MVERRPCSPWMATLLTGLVCLSVWQIIGCPGPPILASIGSQQMQPPAYLLLTATNASSTEPPYELDRLPTDDYGRLMNLSDFRFTMLSSVCNDSRPPLLLVLVHSAPGNINKRATIRATWGAPRDSMHLLFLVGAAKHPRTSRQLVAEQRQYSDLVQGSFRDAYRNMTYKHVMALKYAAYHCPRARYVLKTDDDVFVNMPTMMAFLSVDLSAWGARRLLFCDTLQAYVKRSFRSKWHVSFREYRNRTYPPYCGGWAILYSPDVVFALYREAQHAEYFWIDDVFVTGILAAKAHIEHTKVNQVSLLKQDDVLRLMRVNTTSADFSFLYGPPNMDTDLIRDLWKIVNNYHQRHHITTAVAAAALAASAVGTTDELSE